MNLKKNKIMKKITLLLLLFIASFTFSQVTIGTGDAGSNSTVIDLSYNYSYTQSIYLARKLIQKVLLYLYSIALIQDQIFLQQIMT